MQSDSSIEFSPFHLDLLNEQLWRGMQLLPLRPKPFAVLAYLATHAGRLVPHAELVKAVWPDTYVGEGLLRGYIREVRTVLGDDPEHPRFIETIPRRGYRFLAEVVSRQYSVVSRTAAVSGQSSVVSPPLTPPLRSQLATGNWPLTTPLVGRDAELTQLHTWLAKALQDARQVVFVMGEPGIGKTTVVDAFLHSLESAQVQGSKSKVQEDEERQNAKGKTQKAKVGASSPAPSPQLLAPVLISRGQCIEHYGAGEAYLPVLEALGLLCRQPRGEQVIALLSRYAPTWLVQMPALISDAELEAIQRRVQGATRERMLRELVEAIEVLTATTPLVLVLEDLHWSDYSTLDLFSLLARRRGPARLLLLGTYRPADVIVSGHPLKAMKQELQVHGHCEELPLGFLTAAEVTQYLAARFPQQQFPSELGWVLYKSTEGNPLFMVNVVDDWVRQGVLIETQGQWKLAAKVEDIAAGVPESLRQMIEKQLKRLTPEERRIVETASVVGGEFLTAAIAAGLEDEEEHVEEWCERLAKRAQFIRAHGTETLGNGTVTGCYGFLHALYQQVLYERLAAARRIYLHRRIGEWEEGVYGKRVSDVAAELAVHFERGQDYARAVRYLTQAADNAMRRHAYQEAITLLTRALEILKLLPDTPERAQQELTLQIALGASLTTTKGYAAPEVERVYARAQELCRQVRETPQLSRVLLGLFTFYLVRAEHQTARELGEQLLCLAQSVHNPAHLLGAHQSLGTALFHLGEFTSAREHLEQGMALYDPQKHRSRAMQNPGVACLSYVAWSLWMLGYPEQALKKIQEALTLAQELSHPFSLAWALNYATGLRQFRQEVQATQERAEALIALSSEQMFAQWLPGGLIMRGWALAKQGQGKEGITQIHQGLAAWRTTGSGIGWPWFLTLLAEAYEEVEQAQEGLTLLAEALATVNKTGEHMYEVELHRLQGELTLQQSRASLDQVQDKSKARQKAKGKRQKAKISSPQPLTPSTQAEVEQEAEVCFLKAIDIARQQQAKSLELRATMSLARLWQQQGKTKQAHKMLVEIYGWFTEGFETVDLKTARALLEELSGVSLG